MGRPSKLGVHPEDKRTPEYGAWRDMRNRCLSPKNRAYHRYGGRGITICERWRNDYQLFLADMGARPSKRHSLDRINNDGPYSPENCAWRRYEEQNRNRTNTVIINWRGRDVSLSRLAARTKLDYNNLYRRIFILKWSVEDALITPYRKLRRGWRGYDNRTHDIRSSPCCT